MNAANQPRELRFVPADSLSTEYANLVRVVHSPLEFTLDFSRFFPGDTQAVIFDRIVMSPLGAKLLARALAENLARYEAAFGEIPVPSSNNLADQLFRPQPPQE